MKLTLGECWVEAEIDIARLKQILVATWDLKEAVYDSVTIYKLDPSCGTDDPQVVKDLFWLAIDWGEVIDLFKHNPSASMKLRVMECDYEDRVSYEPGSITADGQLMEFEEKKVSGKDVFITQSYVSSPNHTIKNYLKNTLFVFANKKWKPAIQM